MSNKDQLQKELKEKIKAGVKPSDLKKARTKPSKSHDLPPPISIDEGYQSDPEKPNIPTPPPPPPNQTRALLKQIELHQEIKKADERYKLELRTEINEKEEFIRELQERNKKLVQDITTTKSKIQTLIKLAGEEKAELQQTIGELRKENSNIHQQRKEYYEKIIQQDQTRTNAIKKEMEDLAGKYNDLQKQNNLLNKTIHDLKNQGANKSKEQDQETKYYLFTCDICQQNKRSKLHMGKVNGLGIDPHKENKICDWCIEKVDIIKDSEKEYKFE